MTQSNFVTPAAFQDGDILSATRLNALLDDIDILYGYHFSVNLGGDRQRTTAEGQDNTWSGWVVLNGNQLKINVHYVSGVCDMEVKFNNVIVETFPSVTTGVKTVAVTGNRWQPYNVRIRTHGSGFAYVDQVYMTQDASFATSGNYPAFTDATTSDASDFNAIVNGITVMSDPIVQPSIGIHGAIHGGLQGGQSYAHDWRIQHRCSHVRVIATVTAGWGGDTTLNVVYNNVNITNGSAMTATNNDVVYVDEYLPVPAGLSVGSFYRLFCARTGSADGEITVEMVCEEQRDIASGYGDMPRWKHGDWGAGDAGGQPQLVTLSDSLQVIDDAHTWTNWVQREPTTVITEDTNAPQDWRFYHIRRWRWLAWAQQHFAASPKATIYWTYNSGRTWQAYTLPTVQGQAYFDLDSSPVKVGMLFYVAGALYAIQTPYTPAGG